MKGVNQGHPAHGVRTVCSMGTCSRCGEGTDVLCEVVCFKLGNEVIYLMCLDCVTWYYGYAMKGGIMVKRY